VGSDEVAGMLHPHVLAGGSVGYRSHFAKREQVVVHAAIEALLWSGIDVVCDDPFLLPHYLEAVRELVEGCGAALVIWDMTGVNVEKCIARDKERARAGGRSIGSKRSESSTSCFRNIRRWSRRPRDRRMNEVPSTAAAIC
jgi:chloramphenicol 3-O-phosphotransferase